MSTGRDKVDSKSIDTSPSHHLTNSTVVDNIQQQDNNGSNKHQTKCTGSGTTAEKQSPHTSWYEGIQFKAQYHHYRTNNYVAVVRSANSLDRVTTSLKSFTTNISTSPLPPSQPPLSSQAQVLGYENSHGTRDLKGQAALESARGDTSESACWNFPRVKLRSLFNNTKSLDDILDPSSQPTDSFSPSKISRDSLLKRTSVPTTVPSTKITTFLLPPKSRPRSSSTESHRVHYHHPTHTTNTHQIPIQSKIINYSLLAHSKSATDVHIEYRPYRYHFPERPQVVSLSSSSSETNFFPSQTDLYNKPIPKPKTFLTSQNNKLSVPQISIQLALEDDIPNSGRYPLTIMKQGTHFKNKVEPIRPTTPDRKLVVASVSYLQRPTSPTPFNPVLITGGTPGISPVITPQGLSPSSTSVFNSPIQYQNPPARIPQARFFTSCCGKNGTSGVLDSGSTIGKSSTNFQTKGPVGILKHPPTSGNGNISTTCSTQSITQVPPSSSRADESQPRPVAEEGTCEGKPEEEVKYSELKTTEGVDMAELQSPHYVKRTAHMFNSKFISQNGNNVPSVGCSPSYINVSRSVSGYSCLTYGSSETSNGHSTHYTSNGHHASRPPIRTNNRSILRHHTSLPSQSSPDRTGPSRQYSDTSPPPLPKSAPPLTSPTLVVQSSVGRSNQNGRSFILQRIERLYGQSQDLDSTLTSWKRRTPPPNPTAISCSQHLEPTEHVISIQLEGDPPNSHENVNKSKLRNTEVDGRNGDLGSITRIHQILLENNETTKGSSNEVKTVDPLSLTKQPVLSEIVATSAEVLLPVEMLPTNNENYSELLGCEEIPKNGTYFLGEIEREKEKIEILIQKGNDELEKYDPVGEEAGKIRAAVGKAKLLVNKKFKQFEGLCHANLEQTNEGAASDQPFQTKNEDLEGFWDMVLIQVDQIYRIFDDLDPTKPKTDQIVPQKKAQAASRKIPLKKTTSVNQDTKSTSDTPKAKTSATTSARDETRRKMLADKRRAMKAAIAQDTGLSGGDSSGQSNTTDCADSAEIHIFTTSNEEHSK